MPNEFALDITRMRRDAQAKMDQGAATNDSASGVSAVIEVLNQVVATEIACWPRDTRRSIAASGTDRAQVAAGFTEHAAEERQHMERAAERVSQPSGTPGLPPGGLSRSRTGYTVTKDADLTKTLEENLVAERASTTCWGTKAGG